MMSPHVLDRIDPRALGEKLQHARKRCGFTQADAARVLDVARTTITAIEKGDRRITSEELLALAGAYGTPVSDFVSERPAVEPFEVQFRAAIRRSEADENQIESVIAEWEDLCRNYVELEELSGAALAWNYPPEYQVEKIRTEAAAESLALRERARLGLGDGPIPLLRDILEQEVGLRIFYIPMPSTYSEIYAYEDRLGACMAVNLNHPEERRRWSMSHGYLHFLVHRRVPVFHYEGQYQRIPRSERLAEAFALYFLMPTSGLVKRFGSYKAAGKFTPADLCTLAHYYGVAVEAVVYRLESLSLLPAGTWDTLKDRGFRVRKAQSQLGLTELPHRADRLPLHYQHLAIEALDQGRITEGRFARLMKLGRLEARGVAALLREHSSGMADSADFDLTESRE